MIRLVYLIRRLFYRRYARRLSRFGIRKARAALREDDYTGFALALALAVYGFFWRRRVPKLIYSTSIDTDQSFGIRVLRGRRPIARYDVTADH